MRFKLLRRRLTISAPHMAIKSTLPWPLRWIVIAVVLGFCAALALWAFEFGREIAGFDKSAKEELPRLRTEVTRLKAERDKAQTVADTSASLLATEHATQERLTAQVKQLELDNRALRDDLGFFEKLLPASSGEGISIRGLQAQVMAGNQLKWQVLVMQGVKNSAEFKGRLELVFTGVKAGKPWSLALPPAEQNLQFRQYRRIEGVLELPPDVTLKSASAKVLEGSSVKATQTSRL